MRFLRKFMGWVFGISSMLCILGEYSVVLATIKTLRQYPYASWNFKTWLLILLLSAIVQVITITFGVAWWTNWKEKLSARGWGIAASLIFVLISISVFFDSSRSVWGVPEIELAIGVIGLITFSRRIKIIPKSDGPKSENDSN